LRVYRYVIEFQAVNGHGDEAMRLLGELREYFRNNHDKTLDTFYLAVGTPGSFQAMMDFSDLAQFEAISKAVQRDPEYKALADRARRVFQPQSMTTRLYYQI
jgi:hypothetical protein